MKHLKIVILFLLIANLATAQSPFKRLQKPQRIYSLSAWNVSIPKITAWRFLSPILGYTTDNQIVTGSGFGYNKLHYVDSTEKWYTDISINAMVYAGGRVNPSFNPNNIASIGISIGLLNQLIILGPAYNLPILAGTKGKIIGVVSLAVPLN
jgi:hypothetical protein